METLKYTPEIKERELKPEVKLFGNNIDQQMTKYAETIINFNKIFNNKENYNDLKSWQSDLKNIDTIRKNQHDATTKAWLGSDFYNGTYNQFEPTDEHTFALTKEEKQAKFQKTRTMVANISQKVYVKLLSKQKQDSLQSLHLNKEDLETIKSLKEQGVLKYHDATDLKPEIDLTENKTIFHPLVDNAIQNYIQSNNSFARLITRFDPNSEKAKELIKNADERKTNYHREIIKAMINANLLPPINEHEWLYEKWDDKQNNQLRQIAEKLSEYYIKLIK